MKLNIYNKKKVVKTYTAEAYDIEFGVLEDVVEAVNLDGLKIGSNAEITALAVGLVTKSTGTVKELMKDIFEGLTDEELRHVKIKEMGAVVIDLVRYTIKEIAKGSGSKN